MTVRSGPERYGRALSTDEDAAFFDMIRVARDRLEDMVAASRDLRGGDGGAPPAADSQAMHDLDAEFGYRTAGLDEPVANFQTLSDLMLVAAEDHIVSTCLLVAEGDRVSVYSHTVLARAASEACARSFWLVADVGTRSRIERGINETIYSLGYLGQLPPEVQTFDARARVGELHAAGERLGFERIGKYVAEKRPKETAAIQAVYGDDELGRALYNYQSAVAHGTAYGLAASMARDQIEHTALSPHPRVPNVTTASGVLGAFASVELALVNTVERRRAYFGWPANGWRDADWETRSKAATGETMERLGLIHHPGN